MMINEISTCPQKSQHHTLEKYSAGSTYTIVFDVFTAKSALHVEKIYISSNS